MKVVIILMAFLVAGSWAANKDPTDGLGCKTEGNFTFCEGKSDTYTKLAGDAKNGGGGGLDTRSRGGENPLLKRHYGTRSNECDQGFGGKCQMLSSSIAPTYLVNSQNKGRYILQMGAFQQTVQLAICQGKVCGQYGFCEQNYLNVQLLAWDPYEKYPVLLVDTFQIPTCCKCKRGGSRKGPGGSRWD